MAAYRRHEPAKRAELPAADVFITVEAVEWGEDIGKFTVAEKNRSAPAGMGAGADLVTRDHAGNVGRRAWHGNERN